MELLAGQLRQKAFSTSTCASCLRAINGLQLPLRGGLQNRPRPRPFHASYSHHDSAVEERQVQPLSGYYEDLLAASFPRAAQSRKQEPPEPTAKIFYGAERRYRGVISDTPDSTWRTINGVPIPPRPDEPDNCCMSGCIHCVWDDYRDEVESWAFRLREAQAKARGGGMKESPKVGMSRPEVTSASGSMDDDGGGSEGLWDSALTAGPGEDLFQSIPVGIREFMATEKRLRDRKKKRSKAEDRG